MLVLDGVLAQSGNSWSSLPCRDLDRQRTGPTGTRVTVLVVDDNEQARFLTGRMLRDEGYAVVEADSGERALRALEEQSEIQVILTDIVMPGGMDGLELAKMILSVAPWRRVVLMSGYPRGFSQLAKSGTRIPILIKPFSAQELAYQIREVLRDKMN